MASPRRSTAGTPRTLAATALVSLATFVATGTPGCGANGDRDPVGPSIVLLSIDTLRADRLPVYGYAAGSTPALDRFAEDATVYTRAYAQTPLTLPSHASMLSGLAPPEHGVRDNSGYRFDGAGLPYLPRLLHERGYRTGAAVSSYVLRRATGMATGFDWYDDAVGDAGLTSQRVGHVAVEQALAWLGGLAPEDRFFLFVHLYEPHAPWTPPEPFASRFEDPYDGEVAAADALAGRLFDGLRGLGRYRDAAVVVVSDHGEGLGDHGEEEHGLLLYREALHVPLMIKWPPLPEWTPRPVIDTPVALSALAPTLIDIVERRAASSPLATIDEPGHAEPVYSETYFPQLQLGWSPLTSVIDRQWHLIDGPAPELYDLVEDPQETRDLAEIEHDVVARLRRTLGGMDRLFVPPAPIDDEAAERLRALGYLSGGQQAPSAGRVNPVDHLATFELIRRGARALAEGRASESAALLERAREEMPESAAVWEHLAQAYQASGRTSDARAAFDRAVSLAPGNQHLVLAAARFSFALGEIDRAQALAESVRHLAPAQSGELLAGVALVQGRMEEARRHAEDVLGLEPQAVTPKIVLAQVDLAAGRLDAAEAILRQATADQARSPDPPVEGLDLLRGVVAQRRGDVTGARAALQRELDRHPRSVRARLALAGVEARAGNRTTAIALLEELAVDSSGPTEYQAAIQGLRALGFEAEAQRLLERARARFPDHPAFSGGR